MAQPRWNDPLKLSLSLHASHWYEGSFSARRKEDTDE